MKFYKKKGFRILLSTLIIILLFSQIDLNELISIFNKINFVILLSVLMGFSLITTLLKTIRWKFILNELDGKITSSYMAWLLRKDWGQDTSNTKVYVALNTDSVWTECTAENQIPGITAGMDTSSLSIQVKVTWDDAVPTKFLETLKARFV